MDFEWASSTSCPFQTALRVWEGGCTSCERKPAAATAGEEDAPSLPLCSPQLIDAGSLLHFGLLVQCEAQLCHRELLQSPACRWALRAAQRRLATFALSLYSINLHRADSERECHGLSAEVESSEETVNMATRGSQILSSVCSYTWVLSSRIITGFPFFLLHAWIKNNEGNICLKLFHCYQTGG